MAEWESEKVYIACLNPDRTWHEIKTSKLYQPFTVKGGKILKWFWVVNIGTYVCLKVVFLLVFSYILIIVMKKGKFF